MLSINETHGGLGSILNTSELSVRLDALSDAWNKLRNDIQGRGVAAVQPAFAKQVLSDYSRWRTFYETIRGSMFSSVVGNYGSELDAWQRKYEELYNQLANMGAKLTSSPTPNSLPREGALFKFGADEETQKAADRATSELAKTREDAKKLVSDVQSTLMYAGVGIAALVATWAGFKYFGRKKAALGGFDFHQSRAMFLLDQAEKKVRTRMSFSDAKEINRLLRSAYDHAQQSPDKSIFRRIEKIQESVFANEPATLMGRR